MSIRVVLNLNGMGLGHLGYGMGHLECSNYMTDVIRVALHC